MIVAGSLMHRMVVGRIATMAMMIGVGVVYRVEWRTTIEVTHRIASWRRRGDDVVAIIIEAVG